MVKDVPVDAFWSVSVYNAQGYFEKNPYDAYTINNLTAKKSGRRHASRSASADATASSPTACRSRTGWNYTVRLYRPRAEILVGCLEIPGPAAGEVIRRAGQSSFVGHASGDFGTPAGHSIAAPPLRFDTSSAWQWNDAKPIALRRASSSAGLTMS